MSLKKKIKGFIKAAVREAVEEVLIEKNHDLKFGLQQRALLDTSEWIADNCPINLVHNDRYALLETSIKIANVKNGSFLEFGVYKGSTINFIAKNINPDKIVYGFDSFEGLQEPWIFGDSGGFSDLNGNLPKVEKNVKLIKGFFEDSLPEFVKENDSPIALLHIDADLYSSTKTIFENLAPFIVPGTLIVFDEFFNYPNWKNGEYLAWTEFVNEFKVDFQYVGFTFQRTKKFKSGNQLSIKILEISR